MQLWAQVQALLREPLQASFWVVLPVSLWVSLRGQLQEGRCVGAEGTSESAIVIAGEGAGLGAGGGATLELLR